MPIERLLIANRGEIARRIMRTCRRLGIETVVVFSEPDARADFVGDADLAVSLGGSTPAESYLAADAIVEAGLRAGADSVHPGYGFLAENGRFAQAVVDAGMVFVGPSPAAIEAMGSKLEAKEIMERAGVPLLPSLAIGEMEGDALAVALADVGYPLLIKASAGGGGRGMRLVTDEATLAESVEAARREAGSAFGDATVYAERYVAPSRHVEVQIFGDRQGRVIHFGERECSIQRRHQKIIEESPCPSIDDATRDALHQAAVRAGEAIGYTNAGTVEFLLDAGPGAAAEFYFLEVNTRLQVEHPVTEAVYGVDLVELQLQTADGVSLPPQDRVGRPEGHAIEARLYAEDPTAGYRPSTGRLHRLEVPGPVRVDSSIDSSGAVSQFYDPMVAKVIAHGADRHEAARHLASSLAGAAIVGLATNRELLVRTLRHPEFLDGRGDTGFLERNDPAELGRPLVEGTELALAAAAAALAVQAVNRAHDAHTPSVASGFRNVSGERQRIAFATGDRTVDVGYRFVRGRLAELVVDEVQLVDPVLYRAAATEVDLEVDGIRRCFTVGMHDDLVSVTTSLSSVVLDRVPRFVEPEVVVVPGSAVASMPGTVVAVHVAEGDHVEPGDSLVTMEAMKMELAITAVMAGTVASVAVTVGEAVDTGAVLVVVEE